MLKKKIVIIASCLLIPGLVLLYTSLHYLGLFLVVTGTVYLILCGIIIFVQKHTVRCPSCDYEVIGACKVYRRTGISKCPKCGAIIFAGPRN